MDYKQILKAVSDYTKIPENIILSNKKGKEYKISDSRQLYYIICFKFGINGYELSKLLGKSRTTVISSIRDSKANVKDDVKKLYKELKNE